jgi:hypothetical protein
MGCVKSVFGRQVVGSVDCCSLFAGVRLGRWDGRDQSFSPTVGSVRRRSAFTAQNSAGLERGRGQPHPSMQIHLTSQQKISQQESVRKS